MIGLPCIGLRFSESGMVEAAYVQYWDFPRELPPEETVGGTAEGLPFVPIMG